MDAYRLVIQRDGEYPLRLRQVPAHFERQFGERLLQGAKRYARRAGWQIDTLDPQGGFVASADGERVWVRIEPISSV